MSVNFLFSRTDTTAIVKIFKSKNSPLEVQNLIKSIGKRLLPFQSSSIKEEWKFEECDRMPTGWKRARISFTEDDSDTSQGYFLYKNPEGNLFSSLGSVLRKLKRGGEVDSDVQKLREKLIFDGWSKNKTLPENYLFRRHEFGTAFMDPDGNVYLDHKDFLSSLRKLTLSSFKITEIQEEFNLPSSISASTTRDNKVLSNEKEKSENILKPVKSRRSVGSLKPVRSRKSEGSLEPVKSWKADDTLWNADDPTVPSGWMTQHDSELNRTKIKSPSDQVFGSRADALRFMMTQKEDCSKEKVAEMRDMLRHEFWEEHSLLPSDWRMMRLVGGGLLVITETGKVITTLRGARDNVKARGMEELLANWDKLVAFYKPVNREHKGTGLPVLSLESDDDEPIWQPHSDLPSDWKLSVSSKGEQIKDDKGTIYNSRKDAIDAMIQNNSSPSDIFKLWNTLHLEGWMQNAHLPTGWKRKYFQTTRSNQFLSPMMEVFTTKQKLREFMINNKDYTNKDIKNLDQLPSGK